MTTCLRSDIKTRSRRPGADEHYEDLRGIPQPLILPASAATLHVPMLTRPFASLKIISLSFQRLRAAVPLRIALWVLGAVAATSVALWSFVPLQHGLLLTLIAAWFTLPGVVFAHFVYEARPVRGLAAAFVVLRRRASVRGQRRRAGESHQNQSIQIFWRVPLVEK